tara:strand:+ start:172 stop:387 length:216 start_codon:yes stop_codon:yes gene_type:complete
MQTKTNGGSAETLVKALTVTPKRPAVPFGGDYRNLRYGPRHRRQKRLWLILLKPLLDGRHKTLPIKTHHIE